VAELDGKRISAEAAEKSASSQIAFQIGWQLKQHRTQAARQRMGSIIAEKLYPSSHFQTENMRDALVGFSASGNARCGAHPGSASRRWAAAGMCNCFDRVQALSIVLQKFVGRKLGGIERRFQAA
jgi:hypothetical protein